KGTGLKMGGKIIGKKIFERTIRKQVTSEALTKINQKVGFRLVTKFGQRGLVSLSRLVPIVAGLIGGSHDFLSTNIIGKVAKNKSNTALKQSPLLLKLFVKTSQKQ